MTSIFTSLTEVVTFMLTTTGSVIDTVTGNPILLVGFGTALLTGAVGLYRSLVN